MDGELYKIYRVYAKPLEEVSALGFELGALRSQAAEVGAQAPA